MAISLEHTALVLVDIQNDYFPGGAFELVGMDAALSNAQKVLTVFRNRGLPIVHIRHEAKAPGATFMVPGTRGSEIHAAVSPREGETVLTKQYPNSFRETALRQVLEELGVRSIVVAGMMSLMCIDATVRAGWDMGYDCTVVHDACAARALAFNGVEVPAAAVHAAFMAALQMRYATMVSCDSFA